MPEQDTTFHFLMEDVSDLSVSELADALTRIAKQLEQWPDEDFIQRGMRIDGNIEIETQRRSSHALRFSVKRASSPSVPETKRE
jgi:hypothetical protein